MATVNDKGSIGVAMTVADLLRQGYYVFLPFDGSSPVDLIVANREMLTKRLQVKYRVVENRKLRIPLSSVVNGKRVPIKFDKIDEWAVYCPNNDQMYYISKSYKVVGTSWIVIDPDDNRGSADVFWSVNCQGDSSAC